MARRGATQLDLFASAEDQSLLKAMERQAEYRSRRANEYYKIAQVLRTAMQKGGKLELNAAYAKELGIKKRSSREDLAKARDLAVEKQLYWENAVQLEDADKAEMDRALAEDSAATRFSMRVNPNLRQEVGEVVVGRRADGSKVGRHGRVVFSSMPDILKWLGLPDLEIETDRARIAKIVAKHHLTTEQIADLPNRYDKPASVFRDGANAYVVLTDMIGKTDSGADKPVMVRLTRKDGRKGETVFVASAYPREIDKEAKYVRLANTPGAALFVDKDKVATLGLEEGTTSILCTLSDRDDVMTPEDFSSFVTARIVSQNGVGAQGGESVQVEVEGDGIVEKVKRLARPAAEPGADAAKAQDGAKDAGARAAAREGASVGDGERRTASGGAWKGFVKRALFASPDSSPRKAIMV